MKASGRNPMTNSLCDAVESGRPDPDNLNMNGNRPELWQTPISNDSVEREKGLFNSRGEPKLSAQVLIPNWATPNTLDSMPPKSADAIQHELEVSRPGRSQASNLRDQVTGNWKTPTVDDSANVNPKENRFAGRVRQTMEQEDWPTTSSNNGTGGCTGLAGGTGNRAKLYKLLGEEEGKKMGFQKLNPHWVATLMGYPPLWCELGRKSTTASASSRATATPSFPKPLKSSRGRSKTN